GSMGDIEKVARVFVRNELTPLQERFKEINDWLGMDVIKFQSYSIELNTK
ncbi:MAG: Presumed portal vertex protein, partial [Enterobacter asburiae]|nr:Presumed portal vertex protein [Enterobacter asburiae]